MNWRWTLNQFASCQSDEILPTPSSLIANKATFWKYSNIDIGLGPVTLDMLCIVHNLSWFTGDNLQIGVETAKRLGMGTKFMEGKELMRQDLTNDELGTQIAEYDGFAGVYPEHKFALVEAMQAKGMLIGMTGGTILQFYPT